MSYNKEQELTAIVPSPRSTTLACNWRSAPAIVSHNNALFSQLENPEFAMRAAAALLPAHAPGSALKETASMLAAAFAQTAQAMPAGKRWDISGYVRLCRLHEANKATAHNENKTTFFIVLNLFRIYTSIFFSC